MTYKEVVEWLFLQVPNYQHQGGSAYKPGLDRIKALLNQIGNPQHKLKMIHVAGTNGKGSVSHILSAIFQKNGYKTGLFTSPHIVDFRERIKINGELIDKEFVIHFFEKHKEKFKTLQPSFFEITTAMAFAAFADKQCDIAIIETGLGGRLDSTNCISPEIAIITNIGIDHTAFLGNTLEEIAIEKAGIIKENIPVVIGDMSESLIELFQNEATKQQSQFILSTMFDQKQYGTDLLGEFQQRNIHTAITAVNHLKKEWNLDEEKIKEALRSIIPSTTIRGRLQEISKNPRIIIDAAHNRNGIMNLLKEIKKFHFDQLRIVYAAANDKDWKEIIQSFPKNATYYFTQFDSKRSVTVKEFQSIAEKSDFNQGSGDKNCNTYLDPVLALDACKLDASPNDLILVCGSFYLLEKII